MTKEGVKMRELTVEQKIWKGLGVFWYSVRPLLFYLCFPALLMSFGMLLFGGRKAEEVLAGSRNFYHALGIVLTLFILHRRSKKRGSSILKDSVIDRENLAWKRVFLLFGAGFGGSVVYGISFSVRLDGSLSPFVRPGAFGDGSDGCHAVGGCPCPGGGGNYFPRLYAGKASYLV